MQTIEFSESLKDVFDVDSIFRNTYLILVIPLMDTSNFVISLILYINKITSIKIHDT